jgi:colicin import membrane protein
MASLRPEDLNLAALPRNRLGHLKEEAVAELLQRAAWGYRKALAEKQRLERTVEELTQRTDELSEQVASLETAAARYKDPDELARVLLVAARRTAREEREAARQECELMLKKAARRAEQVQEEAAKITAAAEAEASALVAAVEARELQVASAREELDRELATARRTLNEELASAHAEADAALAEARRELDRLETETAMLRSLRAEAVREIADIAESTLEGLESLGAASRGEEELLSDLQLPQ